jgi:hypothetical protein
MDAKGTFVALIILAIERLEQVLDRLGLCTLTDWVFGVM